MEEYELPKGRKRECAPYRWVSRSGSAAHGPGGCSRASVTLICTYTECSNTQICGMGFAQC